jgi:SAM-dependent methyltransferase
MGLVDEKDALEKAFGRAQAEHYVWQTEHPVVAREERELVRRAFEPLGQRVLDLGCGEGATLFHLGSPPGATGLDLFAEKVAFAARTLPMCTFVQGSVYELPFPDGSFDHLLVRDVIHHLEDPDRFVGECARVLQPGGRLDVLEPCRNNPLILLHALTNRAERGELRSTPSYLRRLLEPRFQVDAITRHQPFPLHRIVFHPKLGSPELAAKPKARDFFLRSERLLGRLLPRAAYAYVSLRTTLRAASV